MIMSNIGQKVKEKYPQTKQWQTYWTSIGPDLIVTVDSQLTLRYLESMAGTTGLEPATSAVTGQRSNQLSYVPILFFNNFGW